MPETTDIVTIVGGDGLESAGFLNRDCAFPITRIQKMLKKDEVLANFPVYFGYWNDGTTLPILLGQAIDIDTSVVIDDCDTAVVDAELTEGELIAPNMAKFKLATKTLQIDKLVPAFCRTRNINLQPSQLLNGDGSFNLGSPYAIDFARFAYSTVAKAMAALISDRVMRGDASEDFGLDGLYTQLENGWEQGSPAIPSYLNQAIVIDWGELTGAYASPDPAASATPEDLTIAGGTISLWGETVDVPEDYSLAQFLDDFIFPALVAHWTGDEGGVDSYEIHVPSGTKRCFARAAACIQPCNNADAIMVDTGLRERYADLSNRNLVKLYPSGTELVMLESPHVEPETMWIGPRTIGGRPTYALFFRDMDEMYNAVGVLGDTYGQRNGLPVDDEPLLTDIIPTLDIPFEGRAVRQDVEKISIDCVKFGIMSILGVLALERHVWIKITNITCGTYVQAMTSGVTIDDVAVETHS